MGHRRSLGGQAGRAAHFARPQGRQAAAGRGRRRRRRRAAPHVPRHASRDLDRRSVCAVRQSAGRGLRRDRHRLLRPDRRGAVDPPHDRRARGRCPQVGRAHRALLRLRLDTLGPWRLVPAAAVARALRTALHRGEDAGARRARRLFRRHRREPAQRGRGSQHQPRAAQGTRQPLFDLSGGLRSQGPPAGRQDRPSSTRTSARGWPRS